jgi:hypothetical protein
LDFHFNAARRAGEQEEIPDIIARMTWSIAGAVVAAALVCGPCWAQSIRAPFAVSEHFAPSGWMGDGSKGSLVVKIDEDYTRKPRPGDTDGKCIRVAWDPRMSSWVGLYWQSPAGNWGAAPGRSVVGATKVTFWAAGENGSEVVEFKAGGLHTTGMPYKDSFAAGLRAMRLTTGWRHYEISLKGQSLASVIGAFGWVVHKADNLGSVVFYLDDIRYE